MHLQDLILTLQKFWIDHGCILLQPYDVEMGAGTSHPATGLQCLNSNPWNVVYVQPCRRPTDGRYGQNPHRTQHYYQLQVLMKPSPDNIQEMCLKSLELIGLNSKKYDIQFLEDDWENPTLGAWGLGWEIRCNGMEIVQFTYMQQLGGAACRPVPCEITYGLERLAMYIQNVESFWDITWNKREVTYGDIFLKSEEQYCKYNFEHADIDTLKKHFNDHLATAATLVEKGVVQPAYDACLKASHIFNLLDARRALSVPERVTYIKNVRNAVQQCCNAQLTQQ
jgi:glycyl-tRNA synthetase alpha chain